MTARLSLLVFAGLLAGCEGCASDAPAHRPAPTAPTTTATAEPALLEHRLLLTGGAKKGQPLPMIVAIHGLGDRPERFGLLEGFPVPARVVLPRGLMPYHGGFSWFHVDPQEATDADPVTAAGVREAARALSSFVDAMVERHPTEGEPVVTGFSQGGMLSFALAVEHPKKLSAALPVSGFLPASLRPSESPPTAVPIVALHGDDDPLIEIEAARRTVGALRRAGYDAELVEYPGVGHTVSSAMRRELHRRLAGRIAQ